MFLCACMWDWVRVGACVCVCVGGCTRVCLRDCLRGCERNIASTELIKVVQLKQTIADAFAG